MAAESAPTGRDILLECFWSETWSTMLLWTETRCSKKWISWRNPIKAHASCKRLRGGELFAGPDSFQASALLSSGTRHPKPVFGSIRTTHSQLTRSRSLPRPPKYDRHWSLFPPGTIKFFHPPPGLSIQYRTIYTLVAFHGRLQPVDRKDAPPLERADHGARAVSPFPVLGAGCGFAASQIGKWRTFWVALVRFRRLSQCEGGKLETESSAVEIMGTRNGNATADRGKASSSQLHLEGHAPKRGRPRP